MRLSTGKEIPNGALHVPFADGYVMAEEVRDVLDMVDKELESSSIILTDLERDEIVRKYNEVLPDIEKALKQVWKKHGIEES